MQERDWASQREVRVSRRSEVEEREVMGEDRIQNAVGSTFQEGARHEERVGWGPVVSQASFLTLLGGEGRRHSRLE